MPRLFLFGSFLFSFGILIALPDIFRNPDFVEKYLGISSGSILFVLLVVFCLVRLKQELILPHVLRRFSLFVGLSVVVVACILSTTGFFTVANFVYSRTFINVDRLFAIGSYLLGVGVISQSNEFFKHYYSQVLFAGGLLLLTILLFFSLLPANAIEQVVKEGNLIENSQFLALILSSVFSFLFAKKLKKGKLKYIFYFFGIVLFIVAGDEVAWGQRLLDFQTPDQILKMNSQQETTVHNIGNFGGIVKYIYIVVGLYGSFAYFFLRNKIFAPDSHLFPYFFSAVVYNSITLFPHSIGIWSEPAELMLYLGVMFHLMILYYRE